MIRSPTDGEREAELQGVLRVGYSSWHDEQHRHRWINSKRK